MTDPSLDELSERFAAFATESRARSPLSARLAEVAAAEPAVAGILTSAPPAQQLPVMLLAAVHFLLLADRDDPLAASYPSLGGSPSVDPANALRDFCRRHDDDLRSVVAARQVQTNEIGRCALLLPALGVLEVERGPIALVDVGASAGLNLLLDRFRYVYEGDDGATTEIGRSAPVILRCGTRGRPPLPPAPPTIATRVGLDRSPVDLADPVHARWLRACVWADQAERFERLSSAIELALADPPEVVAGDAVDDLAPLVRSARPTGHPVVVNSWVLSYLEPSRRLAYVRQLEALGAELDLSWVYAEAPALTEGLPTPAPAEPTSPHLTTLVLVRWHSGRRTVERLAACHPHGFWLHWGR